MRKALTFVLALILVFSLLAPAALADDGMTVTSSLDSSEEVPADAFDGNSTEFKGEDGSMTYVYDNGSMKTDYADGTAEGIDYKGNLYKSLPDGTIVSTLMNGDVVTIYPDGKAVTAYPSGSTETEYPDGSTETKGITGVITKRDVNGKIVSMGFENGQVIEFTDGLPPKGESSVEGDNGEKLRLVIKDDEEYSFFAEGNGLRGEVTHKIDENGASTYIRTLDGDEYKNYENDDGTIKTTSIASGDGRFRFEESFDLNDPEHMFRQTVTENGETQTTTGGLYEDGSLKVLVNEIEIIAFPTEDGELDMEKGMTVNNTATGDYAHFGTNGIEIKNADGTGINIDKDGNILWANIVDENGKEVLSSDGQHLRFTDPETGESMTVEKDENGQFNKVKLPNGDTYEIAPDGTITKNGEKFELPAPKPEEPPEERYNDYSGLEEGELPLNIQLTDKGTPLPLSEIVGIYVNSGGSYTYGVTANWKDTWKPVEEGVFVEIYATGDNTINLTVSSTGKSADYDLTYDPATGRASLRYKIDGMKAEAIYEMAFTDLGKGAVRLNMISSIDDDWPMLDFHGVKEADQP